MRTIAVVIGTLVITAESFAGLTEFRIETGPGEVLANPTGRCGLAYAGSVLIWGEVAAARESSGGVFESRFGRYRRGTQQREYYADADWRTEVNDYRSHPLRLETVLHTEWGRGGLLQFTDMPVFIDAENDRLTLGPVVSTNNVKTFEGCYFEYEIVDHQQVVYFTGDSNKDGFFDSADLVTAMRQGGYEVKTLSDWRGGDWNGDGRFNSSDLVAAFVEGRYERGFPAVAVPEPSSLVLFLIGTLIIIRKARR